MDSDYRNTGEDIEYRHIRYKQTPKNHFHLHDGFEIYFLVSGDVHYLIEKNVYTVEYGSLIITNNQELHRVCIQSEKVYERITLLFNPHVLDLLIKPDCDVLHSFVNRPNGEHNKILLTKKQVEDILCFFNKFEALDKNPSGSDELLRLAYLIELLVYINKIFNHSQEDDIPTGISGKLIEILHYVDTHLEEDLTLDFLKNRFYIDKYYLCKLFKKSFGSSIHEYIICKRISKAKKLISEGYSISDACDLCGFKDYSSFFRMFRKHMGFSPSQYKKLNH